MGKKAKKGYNHNLPVVESSTTATRIAEASTATAARVQDFYELDPEGLVELILHVPLEDTEDVPPAEEAIVEPEEGVPCVEEVTPYADIDTPFELTNEVTLEEPTPTVLEDIFAEKSSPVDESEDDFSIIPTEATHDSPDCDTPQHRTIRFRVSSQHLRLSSPTFRTLLQQHIHGGTPRRTAIHLDDDDPHALLILLQILHHRNRDVPPDLTLDSLTKFAILVNKYNCLEAVEPFSNRWIDKLKADLPSTFSETLLPWLFIAWVFRKASEFRRVTRIAELTSDGSLVVEKVMDLPVPKAILGECCRMARSCVKLTSFATSDAIQEKRAKALEGLIVMLQGLVEKYQDIGTIHCPSENPECDAIVLGSLIRNMKSIGLSPSVKPPYEGLTFASLQRTISGMSIPKFCERRGHHWSDQPCGIEALLEREMEKCEKGLEGLDFGTFEAAN